MGNFKNFLKESELNESLMVHLSRLSDLASKIKDIEKIPTVMKAVKRFLDLDKSKVSELNKNSKYLIDEISNLRTNLASIKKETGQSYVKDIIDIMDSLERTIINKLH